MLCKHIQGSHQEQPESLHNFTPICQPAAKPLSSTEETEGGSDK